MPIKNMITGKVIAVSTRTANTIISRSIGLMFSKPSQAALILKFPEEQKIALHMAFVFYSIDVLFVNKRKKIVDIKENFKPFSSYTSSRKAIYAIELPAGTVKKTKTKVGHRIGFVSVKEKNHVNGRSLTITKTRLLRT